MQNVKIKITPELLRLGGGLKISAALRGLKKHHLSLSVYCLNASPSLGAVTLKIRLICASQTGDCLKIVIFALKFISWILLNQLPLQVENISQCKKIDFGLCRRATGKLKKN
jgi:hypothetical protein